MSFLELRGVHKGFGTNPVLRDINLSITRGEVAAVVGYSGAGKTTLINLIAGLTRPDTGTVTMNGKEITAPGPDRGLVFQNYSLLPWLTVRENIELAVQAVFPAKSTDERAAWVERHIRMVGLGHAAHRRPVELSGGMRQRVSLARTLAIDPEVLLLDEPLGALDALTRATLQDEISRITQESGKTVLLITNDPDEAIYLADRIIPLSAGPGATLGPDFPVELARPRDRRAMNHDPDFKRIRNQIVNWLLGPGGRVVQSVSKRLTLPDLLPEDLDKPRTLFGTQRQPRRRSEQRREVVEIR